MGLDGKLFTSHKLRMMVPVRYNLGADGRRDDCEWSSVSVPVDSCITPLGAKLRRYKLDELLELWNVLIGKMC